MNAKIFLLIGFLVLAMAILAIAVSLPGDAIYLLPKFILLIFSMLFVVVAFSSRYYSYLLLPLVQQRRKHIILSDQVPYWLSSTGDAIISKVGSDFIATSFINIPIYVSGSEMTDEERHRFAYQVSRLIGVSYDPVRFSTELRVMDKGEYLRQIKEAIGMAENEESTLQESSDESTKERVRGKLAMWKKMLDHIGSKSSMELVTFASVSALGTKEFEAITLAQQKAKELMNGIGTILGVSPSIIVGSEILKLVEPEYLIPISTVSEEIAKKLEHGEVE